MKIYFIVMFLLLYTTIDAQSNSVKRLNGSRLNAKSIDSKVEYLMTVGKVEGLSLAIINNNEIAYKKAYGFADKGKQTLLDTSAVLYAASFSKAVFAYINMRLWQKGLIDLDKPLSQYLKKPLSTYERHTGLEKDERWKTITPRMCLNRTTGLPNIWLLDVHTGKIDTNLTNNLYFKPGTRYAYSGEGLKLLQKAEEELLGKDLEQIAQEEVFIPAGMTRTSYVWKTPFEAILLLVMMSRVSRQANCVQVSLVQQDQC